jgi:DNA primase
MVRGSGAEAFSELIENSQPLSEFFFNHFTGEVDMQSIDGRARLVELARPALAKIPEGVFREMMFEKLERLAQHRVRPGAASPDRKRRDRPAAAKAEHKRTPMRLALAHLVQRPSLAASVDPDRFEGNGLPGIDILLELVEFCQARPHMSTAQLLELWRAHSAFAHLQTLATWNLPGTEEKHAKELLDTLTGLELAWLEENLGSMPRISEQTAAQRTEFIAMQQAREKLKAILAGRETGND